MNLASSLVPTISPAVDLAPRAVERFGAATLARHDGLSVLSLSGSFYDMGRQHGRLLAADVRTGPIPYYRTFVEKLFGARRFGAGAKALVTALNRTVGARVERALPDFARETVRGIADGAEMSYPRLLEGCTMPDTLVWAASRLMQIERPGPAVYHRFALGLGCTSALAWGAATKDGRLLHARNFDYHGVSCWPRTQAVLFHEPDDGQRYVSVAAAGVALGGVTAMNEAGLTLTVHQHMFTDRVKLGGTPIGVAGDLVMRHAKSLDDAERILGSQTPIGCWTYVIADGRAREVLCWEENPYRRAPRRVGRGDGRTAFGYANVYLDEELGATELNLYDSYWRHNHARHARVDALLEARAGALDPAAMGAILGDVGEGSCRIRGSIAMVLTVGSVVFRPEDGALWVGVGEAPTSHGTFLPLSLAKRGVDAELGAFATPVKESARRAFEHFRRAYVAYTDDADVARARRELAHACELEPTESVVHAASGLLALVAGDGAAAAAKLDEAVRLGHPDEARVAAFCLWRGRAHDLAGARALAVASYRRALALRADAKVAAAARRGLGRAFSPRAARRVHIDMSLADVVSP